ncbi:MAG: TonB-dependent receptor, partial [Deltaproteobacteria bacterium]|nr:TonB-dependent receptor [Deltaproteobacteria bacterium]
MSTFSVIGGDDSRFVTDRHIFRVSYEKMLFAGFTITAQVDYDDYRFADGTVYEDNALASTVSPPTGGSGRFLRKMAAIDRRWEARVEGSWVPNLQLSIIGGVEFEYLDILRWHFPEVWAAENIPQSTVEFTNAHFGTFLQAQYSPIEMLKATAGIRFDYDEIYGAVATPRAGVVLNLPAGLYVKGLFGMAFKGPSFHDLYYYRAPAFYGNPELEPESSITGEGQIGWKPGRWFHGRITGFYTQIDKLIGYSKQDPGTPLVGGEGAFPLSQHPDATASFSQKRNLDKV